MFKAFILVRNLESTAKHLDFNEFTIDRVDVRFRELRETFSSLDVNQDDWIFEKLYPELPPVLPGSPVGGIPNDIEDVLLLLRLWKQGEVAFVKQAILTPSGNPIVQFPYRAINDLNSYSQPKFEIEPAECQFWSSFADSIRGSRSWSSDWFKAARRFFLNGGAKQFKPDGEDVDRISDYATALESTLVPEHDYNRRRMSRRASALIASDNPAEIEIITTLMKDFYDIRSVIVHGSRLSDKTRKTLIANCGQFELRVRQVLVAAVQRLPAGEEDRRAALAALYDLTDEDLGHFAFEKFGKIKTPHVRAEIAARIAKLPEKPGPVS